MHPLVAVRVILLLNYCYIGGNDVLSSLSTCVFGVEDMVLQQKKDRKKRSHQPTTKGVSNALTQVFLCLCKCRVGEPDFGEGGRSIGDCGRIRSKLHFLFFAVLVFCTPFLT